jgi:hypothetical protein
MNRMNVRIAHDRVAEIATLSTASFAALGLPTEAVEPGRLPEPDDPMS